MSASTPLWGVGLFYRVRHSEFNPEVAYRAIAHLDYGETANHQLLFVTAQGKTWCVDVRDTLCLNGIADRASQDSMAHHAGLWPNNPWFPIEDDKLRTAPWPEPRQETRP